MNNIVVGVDAGGSKTRVLVSTLSGTTLADVTGPGAAMVPGDAEHCAEIIARVVDEGLTKAKKAFAKRIAKAQAAVEVAETSDDDSDVDHMDEAVEATDDVENDAEHEDGDVIAEDTAAEESADDATDETDEDDDVEEELDESPYAVNASDETEEDDDDDSAYADDDERDALRPVMLVAGVAGTGREEEQMALQQALDNLDIADEIVVETDATVALTDAFGDGSGIVLVAGTGSIAFGRSPAGTRARCGGWGVSIGDEGSGAWIGRKALSVVAAAYDGREPETALTGAILTAAQVNEVEELIPWAIAADKEKLAALAPTVIAIAMQGDLRANAIIDMAVEELMLHVRALSKRLFVDERAALDVALAGGLMRKGSVIRKRLEKRLKTAVAGARVKGDVVDGARGAVKLAQLTLQSPV